MHAEEIQENYRRKYNWTRNKC